MLLSFEAFLPISEHPWEVPHCPEGPFLLSSLWGDGHSEDSAQPWGPASPRECPSGALGLRLPDAYENWASWRPTVLSPCAILDAALLGRTSDVLAPFECQ